MSGDAQENGLEMLWHGHQLILTSSGGFFILIDSKPKYVGISQNVIQRLRQHVRGTTDSDASLAYRIAADGNQQKMTRKAAMSNNAFRSKFEWARRKVARWNVTFVPSANPLELHLFETYCAMELDTSKWNTFKTH